MDDENITNINTKSDAELVILALNNPDDFLYLINKYEKQLITYILRISQVQIEEAEDILQEVFIKVYQNLNSFDNTLKFSSWIYRITHNMVISHYRKNKNKLKDISYDYDEFLLNKLMSDLDIQKDIDKKFDKKKIQNILSKLDVKYREVLVLKFLEEKSYDEISDILKKPKNTIGTLINRAKKKCKKLIS